MTAEDLVASLTAVVEELRSDASKQCGPAAEALEAAVNEIEGLATAVERRTVLGQATGLLMSAHSLSTDQAWYVLTTYSQNTNRKVYDVAVDIVSHHDALAAEGDTSPLDAEVAPGA